MRVTVCEFTNDQDELEICWRALSEHVRAEAPEIVLLPEMPFHSWLAKTRHVDAAQWLTAVDAHAVWMKRFHELGQAHVIATRPTRERDGNYNQAFVWHGSNGILPVHVKTHLPDENGFWEASWYERGEVAFSPVRIGAATVGVVICTELWFFDHARAYGKDRVQLLMNPRATEASTSEKWLVGGRAAAIVSGAYCLSSNLVTRGRTSREMGGQGWIIDPDGEVIALTSEQRPFVTEEINLELADRAKVTYPRYVPD